MIVCQVASEEVWPQGEFFDRVQNIFIDKQMKKELSGFPLEDRW